MRLFSPVGALISAAVFATPALAQEPPRQLDPFDEINRCFNAVPPMAPVATIAPETIDLRVLVLHHGMPEDDARRVMARVAEIYAPLNIRVVAGYRAVHFAEGDVQELIAQAKLLLGGGRPAGYDVVYTMVGGSIGDGIGGFADCNGGVEYADHAFAVGVGTDSDTEPFAPGTGRWFPDRAAKVAAHEIGHLLGAHHHHATCVEGAIDDMEDTFGRCTLMSPDIGLASPLFGALEGRFVRANAERHLPGAPYDGPPAIAYPDRDTASVSAAEPETGWSGFAQGYGLTMTSEQTELPAEACQNPLCDTFALTVVDRGDLTLTAADDLRTGNVHVHVTKPDGSTASDGGTPEAPTVLTLTDAPPGTYTLRILTNAPAGFEGGFRASARLVVPADG